MFVAYRFFEMMAAESATVHSLNLIQILFDTIANLTFGLIDDLASLFLGVLCLFFLYFGVDKLVTAMGYNLGDERRDKLLAKAREFREQRDDIATGVNWEKLTHSFDYEYHDMKYKQYMKKAADVEEKL